MRWQAGVAIILMVAVVLGLAFRVDGSGSTNRTDTEVYLRGRYSLEQKRSARLIAGQMVLRRFVTSLSRKCPGVMVGAPHDEQFETLALERLTVLESVLVDAQSSASMAYTKAVVGIQWSNRQLTQLVRTWLREETTESSLVLPNLCADTRSWIKSGYRRLSVPTTGFLERSEAIGSRMRAEKRELREPSARKTGKLVLEILEPYESSSSRTIALRLEHLEAVLFGSDVAIVGSESLRLSHALGAG